MLSEKDHSNIEIYLSKQLQGNEKSTFEAELRSRPELMEETRLQRKISQGLQIIAEKNERQELRAFLNKVKAEMPIENQESDGKVISLGEPLTPPQKETKIIPMWQSNAFRIALAASLVGVLATGSYYLFLKADPSEGMATNQPKKDIDLPKKDNEVQNPVIEPKHDELLALNDNQKLANAYYTDLPKFRASVPVDLITGIESYYANKPKDALKQLPKDLPVIKADNSQIQKDSIQNRIDNISFYRGLSYFKNNASNKAVNDLVIAAKSEDIIIHEYANWYLALAYLKNNQIKEAKNTLQEIQADDDSRFNGKALEILKKIK